MTQLCDRCRRPLGLTKAGRLIPCPCCQPPAYDVDNGPMSNERRALAAIWHDAEPGAREAAFRAMHERERELNDTTPF